MNRSFLIGYKAVSDLFSRLCIFAVILLAARFLPAEHFGIFSLAWAAGWIVAVAGDFGLQISLARDVASQPSRAADTFWRLLRIRLLLGLTLFVVAVLFVQVADWPSQKVPFLLIVFSQILGSLAEFHYHLFRGRSRSDLESSLNLASRAFTLLLAITTLVVFRNLPALAAALSVGSLGALLAANLISRRLLGESAAGAPLPVGDVGIKSRGLRQLYRDVLPIGLGIVLSSVYFRVDLFFIEAWRGPEAVAYYNAVFKLLDALRLFPAAVLAVIFPELCRPGTTRLLLTSVSGLLVAGLLLTMGGVWQAGSVIEMCYGQEYLVATSSFRILLFSLPLLFVNFVLTHRLIALNRQNVFAVLCAAGLAVSLSLNLILVPRYGIDGAAWSCLIREFSLAIACAVLLSRGHSVDTGSRGRGVAWENRLP